MTETPARDSNRFAGTNASIESDDGRVTFSFPRKDGVVQPSRWQFRDRGELVEFLAESLGVQVRNGGLRGTVRRRGKYVRRDAEGRAITTFGDPILDLITNEHGEVAIGGQRLAIGAANLREPGNQIGGLSTIDLGRHVDEMARLDVAHAARGDGELVLTEWTERVIAFATVRSRTFVRNGHNRIRRRGQSGSLDGAGGACRTAGHRRSELMSLLKLTMLPLAAVLASAALAQPAQAVPIHDPMPFPAPTHEVSEPSVCLAGVDSTARVLHAAGFAPPAAKNFAVFIQRDCAAGPASPEEAPRTD